MTRRALAAAVALFTAGALGAGCERRPGTAEMRLSFSGSSVGREGELLASQLHRFESLHPGVKVEQRVAPAAADARHQLFAQWLNSGVGEPDVLQIDVVWTPELAAAGWLLPLDSFRPQLDDFLPGSVEADRWRGALYAVPWFVDVGMLYWRTDLLSRPPISLDELQQTAAEALRRKEVRDGFVWQGARYEGLTTVYLEVLGGFGGRILGDSGEVLVDSPPAVRALDFLRGTIGHRLSPRSVLSWQEEDARFAFQNGQALYMRNWPYAYALMEEPSSKVAGRFAVAPMPAGPGGHPTAALGGSQLAVNARSRQPALAFELVAFLTAPEQMLERVKVAGQLPPRLSLYGQGESSPLSQEVLEVVRSAVPRPVTPLYTELSEILQTRLHRALTGQQSSQAALRDAARAIRERIAASEAPEARRRWIAEIVVGVALVVGAVALVLLLVHRHKPRLPEGGGRPEPAAGWLLSAPGLLAIASVAVFPLLWAFWESLHEHDLRMPWRGRPFVGLENYWEIAKSLRFWQAVGHTALFAVASVGLEIAVGLVLALALNRAFRGRGALRALVLVPWAMPSVVAAMLWRLMFGSAGVADALLGSLGIVPQDFAWLSSPSAAWVPLVLADVWKTAPFASLLLLAGLQGIDQSLYEAAKVDGASPGQQLVHITLPLLRPAIALAVLFRGLDALRVFDLVYVLTGGGPGTATEPVSLLTFESTLQSLRFGYGAALSILVFGLALATALLVLKTLGKGLTGRLG